MELEDRLSLYNEQESNGKEKVIACLKCRRHFVDCYEFKQHLKSLHPFSKTIFGCSVCHQGYSTSRSLRRHYRRYHEPGTMENCPKCMKLYPSYYLWKTHMRSHSNERPFPCAECHKAFRTARELSVHTRNHLPIESRYSCSCPVCGKRFTVKGNLNTHLKVHTGEKPFSCETCGKQFSQKGNLQSHQRRHNGKPGHVPIAQKAANPPGKLATCAICFKSFASTQLLDRHMTLHHTERTKHSEPENIARPGVSHESWVTKQSPPGSSFEQWPWTKQYFAMHDLFTLALLQHSIFS